MAPRKSCLITGCSEGGVGDALAHAFNNKGYHVFATARTTSKIPASLHGAANVTIIALDVTDSSSIVAAAEMVRQHTGGSLDVLINNAGAGMNLPGLDSDISAGRKLFDLNFFAALEMIQVFSPMLVKAGGCIVNNASVGGFRPLVFNSIYGASKAALIQAGEAWRLEMAPLGVRVLTLVTGGVATKFIDKFEPVKLPDSSFYTNIKNIIEHQPEKIPLAVMPEAFAQEVLSVVEKGSTGKVWVGGGAWMAKFSYWLSPEWAIDRIILSMKPPFNEILAEERKKHVEGHSPQS